MKSPMLTNEAVLAAIRAQADVGNGPPMYRTLRGFLDGQDREALTDWWLCPTCLNAFPASRPAPARHFSGPGHACSGVPVRVARLDDLLGDA